MDPMGHAHFWGFTPSLDVIELHRAAIATDTKPKTEEETSHAECGPVEVSDHDQTRPLNVLLMQVGDIRHVLKTIAQKRRHTTSHTEDGTNYADRPIHFYIYDKPTETIARHLLLLSVALDWSIPLKRRTVAWLELFGNALLPERTSKYLARQRMRLVDLITSMGKEEEEQLESSVTEERIKELTFQQQNREHQRRRRYAVAILKEVVDLTLLRYKERDELEKQFHSWGHDCEFKMEEYREQRLRKYFGERYDFRDNLIDWDYHMGIKPFSGVIHTQHYRRWRNTGVAFEFGDATYTNPNRSLASYVEAKEQGKSTLRRGFWGDIICSPYHAVGTAAFTGDHSYLGTSKTQKENIGSTRNQMKEEFEKGEFSSKTKAHDGYVGSDSVREVFDLPVDLATQHSVKYKEGIDPQKAVQNARGLFEVVHRHAGSEQYRHVREIVVLKTPVTYRDRQCVLFLFFLGTMQNSMEIAVYNILSWMFEIETGHTYAMQRAHDLYSGLGRTTEDADANVVINSDDEESANIEKTYLYSKAVERTQSITEMLRSFKVTPFSGDFGKLLSKVERCRQNTIEAIQTDGTVTSTAPSINGNMSTENASNFHHRFYKFFDIVVVGGRASRYLDPQAGVKQEITEKSSEKEHSPPLFTNILAPKATVIIETARNVLSLKRESQTTFEQNMISLALNIGASLVGTDRVLSKDTYSPGSDVDPRSNASTRPKTSHLDKFGEHSSALQYVQAEVLKHNNRSGDNPPSEHLVFNWDENKVNRRLEDYEKVKSALKAASKPEDTKNET